MPLAVSLGLRHRAPRSQSFRLLSAFHFSINMKIFRRRPAVNGISRNIEINHPLVAGITELALPVSHSKGRWVPSGAHVSIGTVYDPFIARGFNTLNCACY